MFIHQIVFDTSILIYKAKSLNRFTIKEIYLSKALTYMKFFLYKMLFDTFGHIVV